MHPSCFIPLLVLLLASSVAGSGFSYSRCDEEEGPTNWTGACKAQTGGSPINVCGSQAFSGGAPAMQAAGYDALRPMNMFDNGHTVQVVAGDNRPTLQIGNLSAIVGRGSNASTQTWVLEQMHLHWGRHNLTTEGSEHYVHGVQYPMEAHIVHYNTMYGASVADAHASGKADALLVVGVLFELGNTDADVIKQMAEMVPNLALAQKPMPNQIKLSDVFNGTGAFYSYAGSLTTPPCSEFVTWVVMQDRKTVTLATLNKIKDAAAHPPAATGHKFAAQSGAASTATAAEEEAAYIDGDFRPLQPLNGRLVYSSSGATEACTAPHEPEYMCPMPSPAAQTAKKSGALTTAPALALQALALLGLLLVW